MAAYGKKSRAKVKKAMSERKKGTLKSGSGKKVKSRKQAIAIALNQARESGAKVPGKKKAASKKKAGSRKSTAKKGGAKRKSTAKKGGAKRKSSSSRKKAAS